MGVTAQRAGEPPAGELPAKTTPEDDDDEEEPHHSICPICTEDFEEGDLLRILPCAGQHHFHGACIDEWLAAHSVCPLCRTDFAAERKKRRYSTRDSEEEEQQQQEGRRREAEGAAERVERLAEAGEQLQAPNADSRGRRPVSAPSVPFESPSMAPMGRPPQSIFEDYLRRYRTRGRARAGGRGRTADSDTTRPPRRSEVYDADVSPASPVPALTSSASPSPAPRSSGLPSASTSTATSPPGSILASSSSSPRPAPAAVYPPGRHRARGSFFQRPRSSPLNGSGMEREGQDARQGTSRRGEGRHWEEHLGPEERTDPYTLFLPAVY